MFDETSIASKTVIFQWHKGMALVHGTIIKTDLSGEADTECEILEFNPDAFSEFLSRTFGTPEG